MSFDIKLSESDNTATPPTQCLVHIAAFEQDWNWNCIFRVCFWTVQNWASFEWWGQIQKKLKKVEKCPPLGAFTFSPPNIGQFGDKVNVAGGSDKSQRWVIAKQLAALQCNILVGQCWRTYLLKNFPMFLIMSVSSHQCDINTIIYANPTPP